MDVGLPANEDRIRRRLIRVWIGERDTVDEQIDGLATIVRGLDTSLATMIGGVAARATLARAITLAGRDQPRVRDLLTPGNGLDVARMRDELKGATLGGAGALLTAVLDWWLAVLYWLLRDALLPLLIEVEEELGSTEPSRFVDEEGQ